MITIFSPYGRNEVTAAAIRLADLCLKIGRPVRLVALGVHENNVHPYWDQHVTSFRRDGIYLAAKGATHCVWFTASKTYINMAQTVAEKSRQILVPSWHALRRMDAEALSRYDTLICPSKDCAEAIHEFVFQGDVPEDVHLTGACFDSGLTPTDRRGYVTNRVIRFLMHCDSASIDECGTLTLIKAEQILEINETVHLTLMCTKTWGRRDRARLRGLAKQFPDRLTVIYQVGWETQAALFQRHDWLLLPSTRANFGITASRGLACGLPVVAYNVSPFNEVISDGINGRLVACEIGYTWLSAPVAMANSVAFIDCCAHIVSDRNMLLRMQNESWLLDQIRGNFEEFWSAQLNT